MVLLLVLLIADAPGESFTLSPPSDGHSRPNDFIPNLIKIVSTRRSFPEIRMKNSSHPHGAESMLSSLIPSCQYLAQERVNICFSNLPHQRLVQIFTFSDTGMLSKERRGLLTQCHCDVQFAKSAPTVAAAVNWFEVLRCHASQFSNPISTSHLLMDRRKNHL